MIRLPFLLSLLILLAQQSISQDITCGCDDCTSEILNSLAGQYPCGDRINYLINYEGYNELDACRKVSGEEFPFICGPHCDPDKCDSTPSPITPSPTLPPIIPPSSLYCFPEDDGVSRVTYENMWSENNDSNEGGYKIQVKEGNVCGPGENRFSRNTVSVNANKDELTLQFKRNANSNVWEASEVRVLLTSQQPYKYGNYTFHIKSVAVKNEADGTIVDDILPTNIVLGLFTWDPTDRYEINENWNHEVDIEISRWNVATDADTQFLVQPPRAPQWYRFYSGTEPGTYDQSNQWHSFRWLPNVIHWESTAGGGQTHSYSTEQAITYGIEDFVQCLPADVEIRLNLWSTSGLNVPPVGLANDQYVEVVIDHFAYHEAVGVEYASPGEYCSKHCQCEAEQGCVNGKCRDVPSSSFPSTSPTISSSDCSESPFRFKLTKNGKKISRGCTWVANKDTRNRCNLNGVSSMCPSTCGTCPSCVDGASRFRFPWNEKMISRGCDWVANKATAWRCSKVIGMTDTCRSTCGSC